MSISYEAFMKHAAKVCKSEHLDNAERYQVLKGVNHMKNGDAVVTDSHRLYLAKAIQNRTDEAVIAPDGKKLSGTYPDVGRLIPSSDPKQQVEIDLEDLLEASSALYAVGSVIDEKPRLEFVEDSIRYDSVHVKYHRTLPVQFNEPLFVNALYVLEAAKLFKAAGCKTLTVKVFGSMRPFTLTNDDESLLALILPIRKY